MVIGIIGRSAMLYNVMTRLQNDGHEIGLIVTAKEAPEYSITAADFEAFAKEHNIPFIYSPNVDFETINTAVKTVSEMDVAVSINYTGIIPRSIIDLFKIGILNMHAGDLPKYRGNAVVAWAMINGEKEIVNCVHKMIGGELDSGDIIKKSSYPIQPTTRIGDIFDWLELSAPQLFAESIKLLTENPDYILEKQSTNPSNSLRCYPRKPEDSQIDWSQTAEEIITLINASSEPFSGAFGFYKGEKLTIWRAELVENTYPFLAIPGQVTEKDNESFTIATGQGKLKVLELSFKNKRQNGGNFIPSLRDRLT